MGLDDVAGVSDNAARWQAILSNASTPGGLFEPISRFPRKVLVPPKAGTLFDGLILESAHGQLAGLFGATPEFRILFQQPGQAERDGWAVVDGAGGDGLCLSQPPARRRSYMAWDGLTREWLTPGSLYKEQFWGLTVRGTPALIEHAFSTPADYEEWSVAWYEPGSDMTYEISLQRAVARRLGGAGSLSEAHRSLAETLASQANRFVELEL